ncbi:MAG: DUF5343 domain-containing protein [Pseudomonadales bacterium]
MASNLPYSTNVGTMEKVLEKIKSAPAPDRFTQDFVNTKLAMKGGRANSSIPFLKKLGFIGSDGAPTDLYREFRNPAKSRVAVGKGFRKIYSRLYEMNEYIHDASNEDVLGLIVECTGSEHDNATTKYTLSTFNMLRSHADFDLDDNDEIEAVDDSTPQKINIPESINFPAQVIPGTGKGINLSYTINLNLPATKDIEVFNAIFKSLKEHILED